MKKIYAIVPLDCEEYYYVDGQVTTLFSQAAKWAAGKEDAEYIDDVDQRLTEDEARELGLI